MDIDLLSNIFYAMVRCGTPLLLVALGELVCERAGVLNLGIEGIMTLGWFRTDLRLADNPALRHACAETGEVAALFVISPTQWRQHKMAPIRQRFILAQVDVLGRITWGDVAGSDQSGQIGVR